MSDKYTCYHTQEYRIKDSELDFPIICRDSKAWLGTAYYFWLDEDFAHYWGKDFKNKTGYYSIYKCEIEDIGLLNTTFNREHYYFFLEKIESLLIFMKEKNIKINLKELHRLLKEKFWDKLGINGIVYDDLPNNNYKKNRTYSAFEPLYYKKRIQLAVFNPKLINNFELYLDEVPCI